MGCASHTLSAHEGHHLFAVAHNTQGGVDGVLAHTSVMSAHTWEHIPALPAQSMHLSQYVDRLRGKWHDMVILHFHLDARYAPLAFNEIELRPLHRSDHARSLEQHRRDLQRSHGGRMP